MLETTDKDMARGRVLKTARILKAYFEHKLQTSLELLTEAPQEPMAEGMQFDLGLNSCGLWGVRSKTPLSDRAQAEISATFHGLIGALDNLETRRLDLILLQQKFAATVDDFPTNVIPIRRPAVGSQASISVNDKRWILRLDCLIESALEGEIQKMALELHSQSRRYAFIEYDNLEKAARLNPSELLGLGQITIFVPNILDLTLQEQETLCTLIKADSLERPLLMVGARLAYSDLRSEPAIHLEFLALLSRAYIKLSRPFSEYKDQGLIHYFLDSLAQNPT